MADIRCPTHHITRYSHFISKQTLLFISETNNMESLFNSLVTLRVDGKNHLYDPVGHAMYKYAASSETFATRNSEPLPISPELEPYLNQMTRAVYKGCAGPKKFGKSALREFVSGTTAHLVMVSRAVGTPAKKDCVRAMLRYLSRSKTAILAHPPFLYTVMKKMIEFSREYDWHEPLEWLRAEFSADFYPCSGVRVTIKRKGRHVHHHAVGSTTKDQVEEIAEHVTHTSECCVCQESQKTDVEKSEWFATTCGHVMCDDCARKWAVKGNGNGCPMCRNRE